MSRKPRVQRTPEEKWQIVLEGLKSGIVAETCRKYEIAPNLYYRWKDEVEAGAKAALGGRSAVTTSRSRAYRRQKRARHPPQGRPLATPLLPLLPALPPERRTAKQLRSYTFAGLVPHLVGQVLS